MRAKWRKKRVRRLKRKRRKTRARRYVTTLLKPCLCQRQAVLSIARAYQFSLLQQVNFWHIRYMLRPFNLPQVDRYPNPSNATSQPSSYLIHLGREVCDQGAVIEPHGLRGRSRSNYHGVFVQSTCKKMKKAGRSVYDLPLSSLRLRGIA